MLARLPRRYVFCSSSLGKRRNAERERKIEKQTDDKQRDTENVRACTWKNDE
jgi:hypothetical protein